MTDRELLQMALAALKECYDVQAYPADGTTPQDKTIELLRAALAQPEQEPVAWTTDSLNTAIWGEGDWQITVTKDRWNDKQTPLYTAPPQREPEPMIHTVHCECGAVYKVDEQPYKQTKPPKKKEWQGLTEGETIELALSAFALPEVSSETREKIHRDLVIAMNDQDSRLMLFAANIEAMLKEKNNG